MLRYLEIRDFALIEALGFEAAPGLTVISGETGAGKSLLVDAIAQIAGAASDRSLVRSGATSAQVDALFEIDDDARARIAALDEGREAGEELSLGRVLPASGRSQARIDGHLVPQAQLGAVGRALVDIHGQHEQQALFDERQHLPLLDRHAAAALAAPLEQYRSLQRELTAQLQARARLGGSASERRDRLDLAQYQLQEIQGARLRPNEDEILLRKREQLLATRRIHDALQLCLAVLDIEAPGLGVGAEPEAGGAASQIDCALSALAPLTPVDPVLEGAWETLTQLREALSELGGTLLRRFEALDRDEALLERIDQRLDRLSRLKRKYGESLEAAIAYGESLEQEVEALQNAEANARDIDASLQRLRDARHEASLALSAQREAAARRLEAAIGAELASLGMPHARFEVAFEPHPSAEDDQAYRSDGADRLAFLFSANPGEAPRPLARIASGGEAARIMLAIKLVLEAEGGGRLMIFDEVDSGVGGETARLIGEKLAALARHGQVMCVTHTARVAAYADQHYLIRKVIADDRTHTELTALDEQGRVEELARLLAGDADPTRARALARSLLEEARQTRQGA